VRGVYVHVPFCAARCSYCDFNTYVAAEAERSTFCAIVTQNVEQAACEWPGEVDTVFFGGGTPTLLAPGSLAEILDAIATAWGLAENAEVTVEANPDSVDERTLAALREAGFTRISFGMQSAVPHVLRALGRTHAAQRPPQAAREARAAGFEHVSLDLIYGTPGETDDDWRTSLEAVLATPVDHVSAYALQVEPGTALHARVRRGELPMPDDDTLAARYEMADDAFAAAGLRWYEISNWARPGGECRHNLGYWRGGEWWAIGPGAHGHANGERFWNVRHPHEYARRIAAGESPVAGRERLDDATRAFERTMLGIRLADGLDVEVPDGLGGLLERDGDRAVLTRRGRMLADRVVLALAG
jgi:oxygen-independent coproporphyrinogen-3 oxidase